MRPEDNLQKKIVQHIRSVLPSERYLVFAIPNAAQRSREQRWHLYWTGMVKGIPDLCLVAPGGRAHFIEVKQGRGELKPEQEGIKFKLIQMDVPYVVARSVEDIDAALAQWKLPNRLAEKVAA